MQYEFLRMSKPTVKGSDDKLLTTEERDEKVSPLIVALLRVGRLQSQLMHFKEQSIALLDDAFLMVRSL